MKFKKFKETMHQSAQFHIPNHASNIDVSSYIKEEQTPGWTHVNQRRQVITFASLFLVLMVVFGLYITRTPVASLSVDMNPSFVLEVNAFKRVISVTGANADAEAVLANDILTKGSIEDVIFSLQETSIALSYLSDDDETILVGVYGKDLEQETTLKLVLNNIKSLSILTLIQHTSNEESYLAITEESRQDSSVNHGAYDDEFVPSVEDDLDIETMVITPELIATLAETYGISQTKMILVTNVFSAYDTYTTESDLAYLVSLDITTLATLYEPIA